MRWITSLLLLLTLQISVVQAQPRDPELVHAANTLFRIQQCAELGSGELCSLLYSGLITQETLTDLGLGIGQTAASSLPRWLVRQMIQNHRAGGLNPARLLREAVLIAGKNLRNPQFYVNSVVGMARGFVIGQAFGLLGGGYRLACTTEEVMERFKPFADQDVAVTERDIYRLFSAASEHDYIKQSLATLAQIRAQNINCSRGQVTFNLVHQPNVNYCGQEGVGRFIHAETRTEQLRVALNGTTASRVEIWDDGFLGLGQGYRHMTKDTRHFLFAKLHGVLPYVLEDCRLQREDPTYQGIGTIRFSWDENES